MAGYIRVSTYEQATESLSLDRQKELVERYGATLVFKDVESASKKRERKNLEILLRLVKEKKVHVIVTPRLDRIARNIREFFKILDIIDDAGADIKLLDYPDINIRSPEGTMLLSVLSIVAEMESKNLSSRVRSEKRYRRKNQYANYIAPLGYITENNKYRLDERPFLCLLEDRPLDFADHDYDKCGYDFLVQGITLKSLLKEAISVFILTKSARATIDRFFKKYGIQRFKGRRGGSTKVLSWSPDGFLKWISNPVLQGHTTYLPGVSESAEGVDDLDKAAFIPNTHPDQRLISPDEWRDVFDAMALSRRIGKAYEKDPESDQIYNR